MEIITTDIASELRSFVACGGYDRLFVLVDDNTRRHCLPLLSLPDAEVLAVAAGEESKGVGPLVALWERLVDAGASRSSLMINLGGGVVTDLGGFAAATFKRGIHFVNIPTTLLAAVDAASGGKTGINFMGLKNEIGAFVEPDCLFVSPQFFPTLDSRNLLSGYAEMVKHALLSSEQTFARHLAFDIETFDTEAVMPLLEESLAVKRGLAGSDPRERGIRKALNLGHSFGHAFESLSHTSGHPLPHGYAVMWGLLAELYLSVVRFGLAGRTLVSLHSFAKEYYGSFPFDCRHYDALIDLMRHDKKNSGGHISSTLLSAIGKPEIDCLLDEEEIKGALDYIREN